MEKSFLSLLFLIHFLPSLHLPTTAYTLPNQYFISCGSNTNVSDSNRIFIADGSTPRNSDSFTLTARGSSSSVVIDINQSKLPLLYQTARIFRQQSCYQFPINTNGTYLVRLHFLPFPSSYSLTSARFDVLASGFSLLNDFSVRNVRNSSPKIIEFILSISSIGRIFELCFSPKMSSFAFINAIEVFPAPDSFIPDVAPLVNDGENEYYKGILFKVLNTIYRINIGGPLITPQNDTLWRYWVPDDSFLYNKSAARNGKLYPNKPNYQKKVDEYIAPDFVYRTGKEMNVDPGRVATMFNITWSFNVTKNSSFFVRAHFCDIFSQSLDDFTFNFYIYGNLSIRINPYDIIGQLAAPFYVDFVVDSDDFGLMNISISPRRGSIAFLNGLEIMEIVGELGVVAKKSEDKKTHTFVVVGLVLAGFAFICILAVGLCLSLRSRKPKAAQSATSSPMYVNGGGSSHLKGSLVPVIKLSFAEVQLATNNFDLKLRIGKGGFGNVFVGNLRNGMKVAVKRGNTDSGQGFPEFQAELMVLSKIRHRHLLSLIGYCEERSEMILVYEFMERGTLRDHLYNSTLPPLSWNQRLEICIGAAKGLHYLHSGPSGGYIHRDVKSTNILLDENYIPKVADFGLSRLLAPLDQAHVTTGVKGTIGYLDPDYFRTHKLTEKSDVYSFGVVLLEVLCARPAINTLLPLEQVNLAEWALFCGGKGTLEQIVDPSVKGEINPNSLRKFWEMVEKCLEEYGEDRPTMGDVVWDLEYSLQLQNQTGKWRERHEDSISSGVSAMLAVPNVGHLPSLSSLSGERDDMPILKDEVDSTSSTFDHYQFQVFSQLRNDDR